jgi:ribosomal protein S12 methylthiotransferase accessory factor
MAGESQIVVTFPGGKRVDAQVGGHVVRTDQPTAAGGEDSAPTPFALFAASMATCAGIFVVGFCQKRGLSTEGIRVVERLQHGEDGVLAGVELDIEVPASFPEKYRDALVRVADQCSVKRAIQAQPRFQVRTVVSG